jgi:membrane protein YqaA with SNARE-associated domain
MISIFFLSETFSSLIPLEIFLIWASLDGIQVYIKYVVLFTVLSCVGGIIAYILGLLAQRSSFLKRISENNTFKKYGALYQKWGGVMIIIAAMTPVPYSIICFLSGTFNFPRNKFLLYSTTRILRVILSAWLVWSLPE